MHRLTGQIAAATASRRRPAWRPCTVDGEGTPRGSRFFGRPWVPAGESWPVYGGAAAGGNVVAWDCRPMAFVFQLAVASLPEPMRSGLGGRGLLQMFYAAGAEPPGGDERALACVRLVDDAADGRLADAPGAPSLGLAPQAVVGWAPSVESPGSYDEVLQASGIGPDHPDSDEALDLLTVVDSVLAAPPGACGADAAASGFAVLEGAELKRCADSARLAAEMARLGIGGDDLAALGPAVGSAFAGDKLGGWESWPHGGRRPADGDGTPWDLVFQLSGEGGEGCHAPGLFAGTGHVHRSRGGEFRFTLTPG